jgi:hypothetical protein
MREALSRLSGFDAVLEAVETAPGVHDFPTGLKPGVNERAQSAVKYPSKCDCHNNLRNKRLRTLSPFQRTLQLVGFLSTFSAWQRPIIRR